MRCRGCLQRIGIATDVHNGVYCGEVCTLLPPASRNDWRDDLIVLLDTDNVDRQIIADCFGITKQRVSQIVRRT